MPKKYAMAIVNPVAGAGTTSRQWPRIQQQLTKDGVQFDFNFTRQRGHAIELAGQAASDGYKFIIAVGGDGTVNEVANGILESSRRENVTLGVVNTGTGSDFVRTVGTPRDPIAACDFLSRQARFLIDIGLVEYHENGRPKRRFFINYAGTGFDSDVAETTNRMPKYRYVGATVPYVLALFKTLVRYRNRYIKLAIDEQTLEGRFLSIIAANGRYFGGGMKVAPTAELNDGKLDVITIDDIGKLELLKAFPRIYSGTHVTHPKVSMYLATSVSVECGERMPVSADGELLGEGPARFWLVPQALAIAR